MACTKTYELRVKSKQELETLLVQYKTELAALRVQQTQRPSLPRIKTVRKNIARVLTVINEQHRTAIKQFYMGKKYEPKDQRVKKTRALRRTLTKFEASRTTEKQHKRLAAFPARRYAVRI